MTLFVYITDECRTGARRHSVTEIVERLRANVEETQSLSPFDQFPPPYIVKKKLSGRQPRLVAEVRRIGEHLVVVFLSVMIRGSREYEDFCHDAVAYGQTNFVHLVSDEALEAYLDERTAVAEMPGKPAPSAAEYELLYSAFSHAGNLIPDAGADADALDRIVCESHEWVRQVADPIIQTQLNRLAKPCVEALSSQEGLHFWSSTEKQGWGVWSYRRAGYVMLVGVVSGTNAAAREAEARSIAADLDSSGTEALLQASRRAYPAIVLADEQLWLDLEREEVANMALSPEETEVLESARRSDAPFPLFINGRAGSGKSTILQYLFADILFAYGTRIGLDDAGQSATAGSPGVPLYLTANGELLRNARRFVQRLLTSEMQFSAFNNGSSNLGGAILDRLLDRVFQESLPFMLGLLPKEMRERYQRSKRIDYPRFRRLWEQRFGRDPRARKEHGPDVSWHIIRSYIKGMGSEQYLAQDDYEQLPENQLTVTKETFAAVHEQVWSRWYSTMADEGYWDDQDLARCILDHDLAPRAYSAVFCDEAQDFTRIELEVLLRLSLYSDRSLPANAVNRVPFAFAGDEFQTLNPTGFRWDSVKAAFVEKFIYELDPARRTEKSDLNYRELRYNYRSSEPIVRFSNMVQALRSANFGIPDLRPQRPWVRQKAAVPVLFFKAGDGRFWGAFREQAAAYVVIVPCNEGEEAEYVARDPQLREHIAIADGVPRNVLSATRAKGCEYPAVVVYGFGESADKNLVSSIGQSTGADADANQSLGLQYFINRVYVAVSRPKTRLVIVDTDAGVEKLWKAAKDEFVRERLVSSLKRGADIWASEIGEMTMGSAEDLSRDEIPDRRGNAAVFEQDGRARRDSYLMQQAASAYRDAGDLAKWRECRARALDYDEKALEAGVAYAEAGLLDEARHCLWRAERPGWLRLLELAATHPELLSHIEVKWATALQNKADVRAATEVLERFLQRTRNDDNFAQATYGEPVWQLAAEALLERLVDKSGINVPRPVAAGMLRVLDELETVGIRIQPKLLAEFCLAAEEFSRAAAALEALGEKRSPRYLEARAKSTPYPGNLDYLSRLQDFAKVVAEFEAHPDWEIDESDADKVVAALIERGQLEQALTLASKARLANRALAVAMAARKDKKNEIADRALVLSMELYVVRGDWTPVTRFLTNGEMGHGDEWQEKGAKAWVKECAPELRIALVRAFARSDKLPAAPPKFEQVISKFLRDFLRVKDGKWKPRITYLEAGSAHERTGRITDSLQFYEAVLGERIGSEELHQVRLRWLAVKFRQLEYERARPKPDSVVLRRVEADIQSKIESWRIPRPGKVSDYPELESPTLAPTEVPVRTPPTGLSPLAGALAALTNPSEPQGLAAPLSKNLVGPVARPEPAAPPAIGARADDATIQLAGLRIEIKRGNHICLVTHLETMYTARLEWNRLRVVGTVDINQVDGHWEIPAWGVRIAIPNDGDAAAILRAPDIGVDVTIRR